MRKLKYLLWLIWKKKSCTRNTTLGTFPTCLVMSCYGVLRTREPLTSMYFGQLTATPGNYLGQFQIVASQVSVHQMLRFRTGLYHERRLIVDINDPVVSRGWLLSAERCACYLGDVAGWPRGSFELIVVDVNDMIFLMLFLGHNITM